MDLSHLNAINLRLSHERVRLANAKRESERELRRVWIAGIEREIADEMKFLGNAKPDFDMTDDELMAALAE